MGEFITAAFSSTGGLGSSREKHEGYTNVLFSVEPERSKFLS
jgi:hypothetical protein